jgi:hypothetical protein
VFMLHELWEYVSLTECFAIRMYEWSATKMLTTNPVTQYEYKINSCYIVMYFIFHFFVFFLFANFLGLSFLFFLYFFFVPNFLKF